MNAQAAEARGIEVVIPEKEERAGLVRCLAPGKVTCRSNQLMGIHFGLYAVGLLSKKTTWQHNDDDCHDQLCYLMMESGSDWLSEG